MKIAVEGLGATVGPADGAGRYLLGLAGALARRPDVDVTVYVGPSMREDIRSIGAADVVVMPGERMRRLVAQHSTVPRLARRAGADAVIYLGNYAPLRAGPPALSIMANLLFAIEDRALSISEVDRGHLSRVRAAAFSRAREQYHGFVRSQLARRTQAIVAVSRTLADALEVAEPKLRGRIRVIPPPFNVAEVVSAPAIRPDGAPDEYFLALGRPWAYREYPLALEALAESGLTHALVIVGDAPPEERVPLERHAESLGLDGRLRFAGRVDEPSVLRGWYEGAAALVATSRVEAFGYPLGEAMALGTPVVAVRRTAFPEIVGDGGLLVEPTVEAVAEGLRQVIRPAERDRLAELGRNRAGGRSWDDCAAQLLEICEEIAVSMPKMTHC